MATPDLDAVVDLAAAWTGRSVTLDDIDGHVLAYNATAHTTDRARIDAVMRKSVPDDVREWELAHAATHGTHPYVIPANSERGYLARVCVPLMYRATRLGYLWVLAADADDDLAGVCTMIRSDRAREHQLLQLAATALLREDPEQERIEVELRQAILTGGPDPGHPLADPTVLVVSTLGFDSTGSLPRFAVRQAIADTVAGHQQPPAYVAEPDHLVLRASTRVAPATLLQRINRALRHRSASVSNLAVEPLFGVSDPFLTGGDIAAAYGQAVAALQATAVDPEFVGHAYSEIGIYQYLASADTQPMSLRLERLESKPHADRHIALLERMYDSDAPRQAIADDLHMHRTSLYNHLQRIAGVIGADPLSSPVRLDLHLALKLRRWQRRPTFVLHNERSRIDRVR